MNRHDLASPTAETSTEPTQGEITRKFELVESVRRIMHAFDVRSRRMRTADQITLPQLLCLMAVVAEEGLTSRQIAERLHVSASNLVGVLDRLQSKHWVSRIRDDDDRRRIHIVPTQAGRQLVRTAPSPFGEHFDRAFGRLSERRQGALVSQLALMATLMAPETPASAT